MPHLKTQPTDQEVDAYIQSIDDRQQRDDCNVLLDLMRRATDAEPTMWGGSIIGFGEYHYTYDSGREGDWFLTGFSPRKGKLSIYIMAGFDAYDELMAKLGKHKTGKSCLYVKQLDDVNLEVLEDLVRRSARHVAERYASS